ncbi:class I SAM-dependent methyltransferase [Micromonospora siamensis]|uniref:Methyltransferase small domain-containing protein n=1 Tax=Micromonospora siamensis TaxID=299152 RepID=A0A1C5K6K7_9ACTN|nr:methyltransferase [Micromonospora siamensis]SCG78189.1 Methyltransferase small domain-containing protein [Micromonospora siamensis]
MTGDHYFSTAPSTAGKPREVEFSVAGRDYTLHSAGGVFSADRLDAGTAVLLRKAELPDPDTTGALLDLGCGFGPISCVLASTAPAATVWAVDVNERARALTAANAERVGAAGRIRAVAPDDVPANVTFAQLWSNPPIRIGKAELHELLRRWLPRLAPDGVGWLVVAKHLGGDSLQRWLVDEQGWQVERTASQKGYRVLRVTRN